MCSYPPSASADALELAREVGSWRRPVLGSSGAIFIVGLKRCGQRCDLEFVFVASAVMNARAFKGRDCVRLPFLLLCAIVGVILDVAACAGVCCASGVWSSTRITCATGCQAVVAESSLCWQVPRSNGRSNFTISIFIALLYVCAVSSKIGINAA